MAYADDLVILCRTPEEGAAIFIELWREFKAAGLKVGWKKCGVIGNPSVVTRINKVIGSVFLNGEIPDC